MLAIPLAEFILLLGTSDTGNCTGTGAGIPVPVPVGTFRKEKNRRTEQTFHITQLHRCVGRANVG